MESAGVGTHTSGGVNSAWEGWEMRGCDACEVPGDTQPHWFREPGRVGETADWGHGPQLEVCELHSLYGFEQVSE